MGQVFHTVNNDVSVGAKYPNDYRNGVE